MDRKIFNRAFGVGFLVPFCVLFGFNLWKYVQLKALLAGPFPYPYWTYPHSASCGFPLPFYEYSVGSIIGIEGFVPGGMIHDVLFALVIALSLGAYCGRERQTFIAQTD